MCHIDVVEPQPGPEGFRVFVMPQLVHFEASASPGHCLVL